MAKVKIWEAVHAHDRDDGWEIFDRNTRNRLCADMTEKHAKHVMRALKMADAAQMLLDAKGRHNTMLAYKEIEKASNDQDNRPEGGLPPKGPR